MRRTFIILVGGAAVTWPVMAHGQHAAMPVIGFLNLGSPALFAHLVAAFRGGLSGGGYVEGQNVTIEYRWANAQAERLPEMAADLVRRQVALIVASPNGPSLVGARCRSYFSGQCSPCFLLRPGHRGHKD